MLKRGYNFSITWKIILIVIIFPRLAFTQYGRVCDNLSLESKILKMERKYAIYLPPYYETSERSYPVLYLLHGAGDDQTGWVQFGEVEHIADKAINQGKATPMIIVMPDANTNRRGYFNIPEENWNYEDFFFEEFIPFIEKKYRIKSEKRYRAIAGLSMGGGGTFVYAIHHPELFSSACPLSASCGPINLENPGVYWVPKGAEWENLTEGQKEEKLKKTSVYYMVNNIPDDQKKAVRWYIDCGDDDFLFEGNCMVHIAMRKNNIPHEYRVRDGGHSWNYWRSALPEVLGFVTASFHQN